MQLGWRTLKRYTRGTIDTVRASIATCPLCGSRGRARFGYGRLFVECSNCGLVFALDINRSQLNRGMGMEGSWSGPGSGGYRECFLVRMLARDLGLKRFLLFGTGNTPALQDLLVDGYDVVGADISQDVVAFKKRVLGNQRFHTPEALPSIPAFDAIIAVEVFEHFAEPRQSLQLLMSRTKPGGVICGTTNFYPGGPIEDSNNPGYMSLSGHVTYWSSKSMTYAAKLHDRMAIAFEMVRPGSILPDEKFGQLWPNKRVFFIFDQLRHGDYFLNLYGRGRVLPIDRP